MCTKNYILLNRNLLMNDLWNSDPFTRGQAWVDLLLNTNWKDGIAIIKGIDVPVKRGQACRSIKQLAIRWQWSEGKVKRFLDLLVSLQQISYEIWSKNEARNGAVKTGITTLITITNYDVYQINGADNGAQTERKQSADEAQTETYKKGNKGEEGKEEKQLRLSRHQVRDLFTRYAGILTPSQGQVAILSEMSEAFTAETITEAFQMAASRSISQMGFLAWCKKRMERRDDPQPETDNKPDKFDLIVKGMR